MNGPGAVLQELGRQRHELCPAKHSLACGHRGHRALSLSPSSRGLVAKGMVAGAGSKVGQSGKEPADQGRN